MCAGDLRLPIAATAALKDAIAALTGFESDTEGGKLTITTAGCLTAAASLTDHAGRGPRNSTGGKKVDSYEGGATPPRSSVIARTRRAFNMVRIGST
jgi:hypothetical protein